jgi:type II secretory pathway component PulJ
MFKIENFGTDIRGRGRSGERGVTIIEILVAMTILLMVTSLIFGLLSAARQSRNAIDNQVQVTKGTRLGLNLLGRDTYNAGYAFPVDSSVRVPDEALSTLLGTPIDSIATRDKVPAIIVGNDLNANTFNPTAGVRTDQVTFVFKDMAFNLLPTTVPVESRISQPLNINAVTTDLATGIDEVVPISGSNPGCNVNDIFLVTGNNGSALAVVTALSGADKLQFANGDPLNFNLSGATGPLTAIQTPGSMTRVRLVTYYVTGDGVLTRREFANVPPPGATGAFVDEPLIYNVEDLQIQYIMDDGVLSDDPATDNLEKVRQVRYTLTVRTTQLDSAGQPKRITQTSTFSTRNLGYDAS